MVAEGCPVAPTVTGSGCSAWSAQQGWGLGSLAQKCVGLTLVWGHQVSERGTTASLAPGGRTGPYIWAAPHLLGFLGTPPFPFSWGLRLRRLRSLLGLRGWVTWVFFMPFFFLFSFFFFFLAWYPPDREKDFSSNEDWLPMLAQQYYLVLKLLICIHSNVFIIGLKRPTHFQSGH